MKYARFFSTFKLTKQFSGDLPAITDSVAVSGIRELKAGVYNHGIYQIVTSVESVELGVMIESVFPTVAGKIVPFAVDWMGRVFAIDSSLCDLHEAATVTCFDLAEPSSFTTNANFDDFHNSVAVDMTDELLNINQLHQWTASHSLPEDGVSCIGYKIPLFMGGLDEIDNMELSIRSVYLHLLTELFKVTDHL